MKPNYRRKRLHRKLMTLLSKLGIDDDMRHAMVYNFTGGRTGSTRELKVDEIIALINRLEDDHSEKLRRLRSEILSIATRTGIHDPSNWEKFNTFMIHRSVKHKPLNEYSLEELKELRRQFRAIERNNKKTQVNILKRIKPYQLN